MRKAAEPAPRRARRTAAAPSRSGPNPGSPARARRAPVQHPVQRAGHASVDRDHLPDDRDHRRHGPEIPAHPQDGRADLLVGERRQGHAGDVVVDRVHRPRGEDAQRHRQANHDHVGHQQRTRLAEQRHPPAERRRRNELQPEQHPGREKAAVHQPDMHGRVPFAQVIWPGQVPEDHHGVEQPDRHPRPQHQCAQRAQRPGPAPASTPRVTLRPDRPGSASKHRLPRCARDDQRRGREHQQQVLDHVHEEVVVGPVVDRRLHGQQEYHQPGVEPQRPQPPLPRAFRPGPVRQPPQPDLLPPGDGERHDEERVEGPVAGQVAHRRP